MYLHKISINHSYAQVTNDNLIAPMRDNWTQMKRHVGALSFFVLLAMLALYWPLLHLTTHVPGNSTTDYFHFNWNYWWIRHALTTPGLNIYETNFVMFPFVSNLAYHT